MTTLAFQPDTDYTGPINPATKLPHTAAYLARTNGTLAPTRRTETWTMVGPFRATDKRVTPLDGLTPGWEIVDSQGRTANTAPSRDRARARAREMTAQGVTITRHVPA
jgi:phage tail sheath protein FI